MGANNSKRNTFQQKVLHSSALDNNNIKDGSRPLTAYYRTTQQQHQDIDGGVGHTGNIQPQPDLDTLGGLTFDCFRRACVWLPLADVGRAMTVCKEWRSALDARDFWRSYLAFRYSFDLDEPPPTSPLALWVTSSLDSDDSSDVDERPQWRHRASGQAAELPYIVKPVPDRWRYGVVVPHGLTPPDSSVDVYHDFVRAMDGVRRLREALRAAHPTVMAEVCLFQWSRDRLPGPREVLDVFGFHVRIAQSTPSACFEASPSELAQRASAYAHQLPPTHQNHNQNSQNSKHSPLPHHLQHQQQHQQDENGLRYPTCLADIMRLFASLARERTLFFQLSCDVIRPTPGFLVAGLADGWLGGIMYGF